MPGGLLSRRVRLTDCADLARMLSRLSDPRAEVSGPRTAIPGLVADGAPVVSESAHRAVGARAIDAADWIKGALNKPVL